MRNPSLSRIGDGFFYARINAGEMRGNMVELKINPTFAALIPPLTKDEREGLEQSIRQDGIRDPIITWRGQIIDGHNRYEIARKLGVSFNVVEREFTDESAAKAWMIHNQFARRNLSAYQRSLLALELKPLIAGQAKEHQRQGGQDKVLQKSVKPIDTQKEVAKLAGVSHDTIAKVERIEREATPEIKEQVISGELSINAAYQQVKKPHVAQNSGNNEWYTPAEYIEAARKTMGNIDLDPASSDIANKTVGASEYYTIETDGLKQNWFGNVWLNPPYSTDKIGAFVNKLIEELPNIDSAVLLVNNATETIWFSRIVEVASAVCFPKGRVKFVDINGNSSGAPLQGQAVLYIGEEVNKFIDSFAHFGWAAVIQ